MDALIADSETFHLALDEALTAGPPLQFRNLRHSASASGALLSIEHGGVAREAFVLGAPHAATGLIRLQFEALVRGAWWLYAADDGAIGMVNQPLDNESDADARSWPGATVMLRALEGRAPEGLVAPLRQFHATAWSGLNSYVHAGIHPLQRRLEGFPDALARQMLQNSNGLLHMGYRLLASLGGNSATMEAVTALWTRHRACLPDTLQV